MWIAQWSALTGFGFMVGMVSCDGGGKKRQLYSSWVAEKHWSREVGAITNEWLLFGFFRMRELGSIDNWY